MVPSFDFTVVARPSHTIVPLSDTQQVISLKLSNTNFLYWRMQMKPYLLGQSVYSYVDGSFLCPPAYISFADMTLFNLNIRHVCHESNKINWLWVSLCHLCLLKCYILLLIARMDNSWNYYCFTNLTNNTMAPSKTRGRMIALLMLICSKPICYWWACCCQQAVVHERF